MSRGFIYRALLLSEDAQGLAWDNLIRFAVLDALPDYYPTEYKVQFSAENSDVFFITKGGVPRSFDEPGLFDSFSASERNAVYRATIGSANEDDRYPSRVADVVNISFVEDSPNDADITFGALNYLPRYQRIKTNGVLGAVPRACVL